MLGAISGRLKGEAALVVRDSLRAARHAITLSRHAVAAADPGRFERFEVLKGVDKLAEDAVGTASRLAHRAFDIVERRTAIRLPCPAETFLGPSSTFGVDPSIAFAQAGYDGLRRTLRLLDAPDALVMETRIEAAFVAAAAEARQHGLRPAAFAAALTWQLIERHAISHLALPNGTAADPQRRADAVAVKACFTLGLAMAAASCQQAGEEEADALLRSAGEMASALAEEVAAASGRDDIETLFDTYAPHV